MNESEVNKTGGFFESLDLEEGEIEDPKDDVVH